MVVIYTNELTRPSAGHGRVIPPNCANRVLRNALGLKHLARFRRNAGELHLPHRLAGHESAHMLETQFTVTKKQLRLPVCTQCKGCMTASDGMFPKMYKGLP